jgi:transcriptional regulator with XRE-family HTH domain
MDHPGEVIKRWRKDQKISILALARLSGIDKGTISRFERCGDFEMRVFRALCGALEKNPGDAYAEMATAQPAPLQPEIGTSKHFELLKRIEDFLDIPGNEKWIAVIESFILAANTPHGEAETGEVN